MKAYQTLLQKGAKATVAQYVSTVIQHMPPFAAACLRTV
jgi:hypothetical protein